MEILALFLTALGLSMDAFAVSISKGLSIGEAKPKHMLVTGAWFGGFQALMPLIGYFVGKFFQKYIEAADHWIALALLALIGINMIAESFKKDEEAADSSLSFKVMLVMAIATSIDALAAGVSLAMDGANIWIAIAFIGVITFVLSALGVKFGSFFGARYKRIAEFSGGVILILMGVKIVLEHTVFS